MVAINNVSINTVATNLISKSLYGPFISLNIVPVQWDNKDSANRWSFVKIGVFTVIAKITSGEINDKYDVNMFNFQHVLPV